MPDSGRFLATKDHKNVGEHHDLLLILKFCFSKFYSIHLFTEAYSKREPFGFDVCFTESLEKLIL